MKSKIMNLKSIISSKISSVNRNNLLLSVVALVEIIAIMIVSTSAWVETISTVEISGTKGSIASSIYTNANFDGTEKEIDLSQYFNESGNVHLASASSADGENFFFPKIGSNPVTYRKGTINDVNVNYISFSIRITASQNANDFYFDQIPTIMIGDKDVNDSSVRIAISKSGQKTIIFSKSETAEQAVVAADGTKDDTTVNLFNTYVGAEAEQPIFSVDYQETTDITFTLWLEDPDMLSKYTGQKVTIDNFKLITSEQKFNLTFIDRTTSFNGTLNGLYWVQNDNAKLWAYDATSKNCVELKNTTENPTKWTGKISQEFINNKNNNLYFLRTSPDITAATVNPDDSTKYWNKWTAKLADDVSGGRTFTAYSNIVGGSEKLGTWGDVIEITLDSEDSDSLEKKTDESKAAKVTIKANNVSYEMNYKNVDGVAVWRSCIPVENSNDEFVFSFTNGSSYSYNAGKRGSSIQYVITSASTGYWAPPATVKVIAGTSSDGTALGTVSVTGGKAGATEVKVTPGTPVVLSATPGSDSYRFVGWYTNAECTAAADLEEVEDGHKFTPATNKSYVFYAKFQLQYHIKLTAVTGDIYPDLTGGTVQLNSDAATSQVDTYLLDDGTENANVTFTAANKEGYKFLGWYKTATGTGTPYSSEKVISINSVKENYILYAKYKIKQFSVTAVAKPADSSDGSKVTFTAPPNANTGTTVSVTVDYNGSATFKAIPDDDNGYEFVGWYTDEALSNKVKDADGKDAGAEYTMNNIKPDNDDEIILYAKFKLKD
ncbi:MAG: InlB B-repeat-containing protein, partial [Ruminococcus sp.]